PLLPSYRAGKYGDWTCEPTGEQGFSAGYFLPTTKQYPGWMFKKNGKIWMSLTRMETESHLPHIAAATGHTVVAGLGMGFYLYNILRKPDVTKVTVLEKDSRVVRLLDKVSNWRKWNGIEKLNLVMTDATVY